MKISPIRSQKIQPDEENPYWMSFSDIMAGLLIIFVLASLALILELNQKKTNLMEKSKEIAKAEKVRRDVLTEIKKTLAQKGITVEVSENHSVLRIPNKQLSFKSDEHKIPKRFQKDILEIGSALYSAVIKKNRQLYLDTIFIEGHTDNLKTSREMGNWGLSTFRAISIWNFWLTNLPKQKSSGLKSLKNKDNTPLFSMSGYAETRPISKNQASDLARAKNRRIDIRFTIKRPTVSDIKAALDGSRRGKK
jgi:flagellar motor protein MotB